MQPASQASQASKASKASKANNPPLWLRICFRSGLREAPPWSQPSLQAFGLDGLLEEWGLVRASGDTSALFCVDPQAKQILLACRSFISFTISADLFSQATEGCGLVGYCRCLFTVDVNCLLFKQSHHRTLSFFMCVLDLDHVEFPHTLLKFLKLLLRWSISSDPARFSSCQAR